MNQKSKNQRVTNSPPVGARPVVFGGVRWRPMFICLLLVGVTLAVYWPVKGYDFLNYDDEIYVTKNPQVQHGLTWNGVAWAFNLGQGDYWHPLTWLSYMLDVELFGKGAGGPHLVNLTLHVANTMLLFFLLMRLTGARSRSAMVAGLFALHPLQVESVAWVTERKDVLSVFFGFLSLIFYTRHAQTQIGNRKSKIVNYMWALFFFACGLMSKAMLVTWPFVMLLLDYWPLGRVSSFKVQGSSSLTDEASHPTLDFRLLWRLGF